jgi:hypothetical protein
VTEIVVALLILLTLVLWRRVTDLERRLDEVEHTVESEIAEPERVTNVIAGEAIKAGSAVMVGSDGKAYNVPRSSQVAGTVVTAMPPDPRNPDSRPTVIVDFSPRVVEPPEAA